MWVPRQNDGQGGTCRYGEVWDDPPLRRTKASEVLASCHDWTIQPDWVSDAPFLYCSPAINLNRIVRKKRAWERPKGTDGGSRRGLGRPASCLLLTRCTCGLGRPATGCPAGVPPLFGEAGFLCSRLRWRASTLPPMHLRVALPPLRWGPSAER